jgi:hypothetical protein
MTDQPPAVERSSDKTSEDDQPTLILPPASVVVPQHPATTEKPTERETHDGNPALTPTSAAKSKISRLKKFFTSSPSRKVASVAGAIVLAALSGTAGAAASGLFSHAPKSDTATQHIFYVPWSETGSLSEGIHVASTVNGHCWAKSAVSLRFDAYRCFGPNGLIYDPCFVADSERSVACPMPSPTDVTVIRLVKPLPKTDHSPSEVQATPASTVWLVVLADGDSCYAIYADSDTPGGMVLTYWCKEGNLYGNLNSDGAIWTIWEQKNGTADMTLAPVAQAYS